MTTEPQSPEPQPVPADSAAADLGTRFFARLIDSLLLGAVFGIVGVVLGIGFFSTGFSLGLSYLWYGLVTAVLTIAYFALMESNSSQTVGKMIMKLRTEGPDGQKPTLEQAVKRNAFYGLAVIPFLGGLLQLAAVIVIAVTISNSATNTGWHDDFAGGTRVVKTAP